MLQKKGKTVTGMIIVGILLLIGVFQFVPQEDRDHLNPFIPKEAIYVQINESPVPDRQRYAYTLTGYTDKGEKRRSPLLREKSCENKHI
ncbi:MAG: hypothetical protein FWJ66_06075 [Caldibacillus sp.]